MKKKNNCYHCAHGNPHFPCDNERRIQQQREMATHSHNPTKYARARLEHLRTELRAERISYSELAELLEAAGVPERPICADRECKNTKHGHSWQRTANR